MPMHHCKVVTFFDRSFRVQRVLSILDVNSKGISAETFVKPPYRTILKCFDETVAMQSHDNVRQALKFHKGLAHDLHNEKSG